ncbi:unnamed protein product [Caenorhabditis auriculariae]|uniref:Uncharacterized protein n=1 Tax=Caenorhabditis auriculariae TaxID=2777116 RepID=A0A8S1GWB1_9PELO|nr:unnamed protein product [Caenorhabditis auriculariae]
MEIMSQRKPPQVGRTKTGDLRLSTLQTALRWGDNVTNEALPRCVYCWLKTFPNCPRWTLKHEFHKQFLNGPRGQKD